MNASPSTNSTIPVSATVVGPHVLSNGRAIEVAISGKHILTVPVSSIERLALDVRHSYETAFQSAKSQEEKLNLLAKLVLEHRLDHRLLTFPGGVKIERKLWDLPTEIPEEFFTPGICGLTGFQTYANQFRPNPNLLNPQMLVLIDGAGFGEVNDAKIAVPDSYKGKGFKNEENFVDVFIQITANAVHKAVEDHISKHRINASFEDICKCFRGGDEFAFYLDKTKLSTARTLSEEIIEKIQRERAALFEALDPKEREKLERAGSAIQKRALLGKVFKELHDAWEAGPKLSREQLLAGHIEPNFAYKEVLEDTRKKLTGRLKVDPLSKADEYLEQLKSLENTLSVLTTVQSDPAAMSRNLSELFVIATEVAHDIAIESMPNQALGLNYVILDLPALRSHDIRGAAVSFGESVIEQQKILRTSTRTPIKVPKGTRCPKSIKNLIARLGIEAETLEEIQNAYQGLLQPASPLSILELYEKIMILACGDGAMEGAVRTSVARNMKLSTLWGIDSKTTLYPVVLTLTGMRPINSVLGMSKADELVAGLARTVSPYCTPLGILKHMGDTVIFLCGEKPREEDILKGAKIAQRSLDGVLEQLTGLSVFSAYKLAGKVIAAQFLVKSVDFFSPKPGLIRYQIGKGLPVSGDTSVSDVLGWII